MPSDRAEMEMLAARLAMGGPDRHEVYSLADRLTSEGEQDQDLLEILILGEEARFEEIVPHLIAYLNKQGILLPDPKLAPLHVAYLHAKSFTDGRVSVTDASHRIWKDAWRAVDGYPFRLDPFIYWMDVYGDETFNSKEEAEQELIRYARKLVHDFEAGNLSDWVETRRTS